MTKIKSQIPKNEKLVFYWYLGFENWNLEI